ncbi:helix-turn-helix domain-containing protein [Nocardia sp. CA-128927]|uniref:helix-turn-helix domain-containing protein n=1 Tax=Nocardia sp. CA-128927 TaxID=3239975 RepID=UPI003D960BEC
MALDTNQFDRCDRGEVAATLRKFAAFTCVADNTSDDLAYAHYEGWRFGQVRIQRWLLSGFSMVRTIKHIRNSPTQIIAINVQIHNTSRLTQGETQHETRAGQLFIMDLDLPYQLDWHGGLAECLLLPTDELGLSAETIRTAMSRPQSSPICNLLANHISLICASSDALEGDPATRELGDSILEMARAFLMSAAACGNEDGTALPQDVLLTQIRDYVQRRLADPDLNPARIARAHNVSVRHLYKVCARAGFSLEQWIIGQRLERVRSDLARVDTRHRSIAAIAYNRGLRDPAHLTRRFRAAYGVTPSQWRREALEQASATG